MISMIWAETADGFIGCDDGSLPWGKPIPEDMAWFKMATMGRKIIVGRKTFDLIGELKGRGEHTIITQNPNYDSKCTIKNPRQPWGSYSGFDNAVVIGGKQTYDLFMPICDVIYRTIINDEFKNSTIEAPKINERNFSLSFNCYNNCGDGYLEFQIWRRDR